ncbi:MAG: SDR family NAD(P)-dependent oxidoreductase [Planctomycetota bacterium]|jgi:NAD(P)-dependent dehydrogenase (short-subunit alcohol dehydrogenase family)
MSTVLITGASRGIGAAIARELAERGRPVVLAARGVEDLEAEVGRLTSAGLRAAALVLDVADTASIAAALEQLGAIEADLGPLTALVNNAGIAISAPLARSADHDGVDLYARHMDVNFHGPRRLTEALVPRFSEAGGGRVLNIASSAGLQGYAYVSAYCASKHALVGYTRAAAAEFARGEVVFGALCPHYVDSPMLAASVANVVAKTGKSEEEARAFFASQNPGGKLVQPADLACTAADWLERGENGAIVELTGS